MKIKGSKFLVTGGASGMGRCFTLELARLGADVTFCDVNEAGLSPVIEAASELEGNVYGFVCDVSNEESVQAFVNYGAEKMGGLSGIINNAGITRDGLMVKKDRESGALKPLSMKKWQQVIDVNLTGVFLGSRIFSEWHIANGGKEGVIVSISSISRHGNQGQTNYSAAKAGIISMTALWAGELARYGIRAGAIAPGFTRTPILDGMRPDILERLLKPVPLRRMAEPTEIFQAVQFIIECGYFTGRCIDVDGGLRLP